jgi:hypothetical protein
VTDRGQLGPCDVCGRPVHVLDECATCRDEGAVVHADCCKE